MTDIDTSEEAVEALIKSLWAHRALDADPAILLRALVSERDSLKAQINSPMHAAWVLLGCHELQDTDSFAIIRATDQLEGITDQQPVQGDARACCRAALRAIALLDPLPELSIEDKEEPDDYEWDFPLPHEEVWNPKETSESTDTRPSWMWRVIVVLLVIGSLVSIANG